MDSCFAHDHKMIQVGIIEPCEIMRKGVACLIEKAGGMHVVGQAGNSEDLFAEVENNQVDVVVLEPFIAGAFDLAAIQLIKNQGRALEVLIFSESTDKDDVQLSLRAGVKGFVSKRAKLPELINGIEHLARKEPFLCAEVNVKLSLSIMDTLAKKPHDSLSSREHQILLLLVNGKSIAEVADELGLSAKTVSTHKARLMQKMNLSSFAKLVQYASTHGLIAETGRAFEEAIKDIR